MVAAAAQKVQVPDIAAQITYAMRIMGVSPMPRNYELFYEAYIGSNPKLTRELAALGNNVRQEELDVLGAQYFGHHHKSGVEGVHGKLANALETLLGMLQSEQQSLESYNRILGEAYTNIANKNHASVDVVKSAINILTSATADTMSQGKEMVDNVAQKSREMDMVRQELDEYKRIANTDSLTRLSNRRAFDDRLALVYSTPRAKAYTSLILIDIDNFKKINDTYGHPVGDKILATVGNVVRNCVRKDIFVARTGGEEFAVIVEEETQEECMIIAERIRTTLASTPFKNSKTGVNYGPITLSLGICMAMDADDANQLYSKADIALYCAKNAGRNRSMLFQDGMKKDIGRNWLIYKK